MVSNHLSLRQLYKTLLLCVTLALFPSWAYAQIQVSGSVVDSANEPLPGVSIKEKGSATGAVTDIDGKFKITVKNEQSVLEFSYVGYTPQSVTVGSKRTFDIVLEETSTMLDGVVVIGYGTMDKKELTSAVSHISGEDMLSVSSIDPAMGIQGKVAGVSVTNTATGDPNNGASIQIRGVSSRSAGLGPLIVIDGVAGGNLHNLSPNDIESIDVLKDGAASAIYGTRGSNGVIVVTTKGGAKDCIDLLEDIGVKLGMQLANLINIFNPEIVVIGGTLSAAGDYLIQPVRQAIKKHSLKLVNSDTKLVCSKMHDKAGIIGACMTARRQMFENANA